MSRNTIGIAAIGTWLPQDGVNMLERHADFGVEVDFLRDKTGFLNLRRKPADMETSDMCVEAFHDLQTRTQIDPAQVDCVVVCTQNPDGHGLPHTSAAVHAKLGLPQDCAVFDISLGCSGYVYGLSVITAFMQMNGFKNGLLFTADPYSKVMNPDDRNTAILFGDGATATLMNDTPVWTTDHFKFRSNGKGRAAIAVRDDGVLNMNGRAVFTFCAREVPTLIRDTLAMAGHAQSDIDLFLLHQGSKYIVETIRTALDEPAERAPFAAADMGNTVSSTLPFLLSDPAHAQAQRLMLCGFGVGLSWAACILERNDGV